MEWIAAAAAAVERCAHYFTDINWTERRRDEKGRLFFSFGKALGSTGSSFLDFQIMGHLHVFAELNGVMKFVFETHEK